MSFILKVPTIEEIYNEYHRETMYAMKGIYPRSIKDFSNILDKHKTELLLRFQNMIKRNITSIDWRLYIKACSQYFKYRFDLKILGSLRGNKIYREYLKYKNLNFDLTNEEIQDEIINSLKFLTVYLKESNCSLMDYLKDRTSIIPVFLNHIYAGTISRFFYACFDQNKIFRIFYDIPDDIFFELFNCSRNDFLDNYIFKCRDLIICRSKLLNIINKINNKI